MEKSDSHSIQFVGPPDGDTYLALMQVVRPQKSWSASGLVVVGLVVFTALGTLIRNGVPVFIGAVTILLLVGFFSLLPALAKKQIQKQRRFSSLSAMPNLKGTGSVSSQGIQIKLPTVRRIPTGPNLTGPPKLKARLPYAKEVNVWMRFLVRCLIQVMVGKLRIRLF